MRTALLKTFFKELSYSSNTKGLHNVGRTVSARCISTHVPLTQTVEKQQISEENLMDPLQHKDYFNVRNLVTVKELFLNYAHFGHVSGCRNVFMTPYLFGTRKDVDIFDLEKTVEHFQDALNIAAHVAYREGIILFVSRSKMVMPYVEKTAKDCGEYAHCRYWSSGIFTDMINRLGQNIRLPDLVIFLNTQNSVFQTHRAVIDSAKMLIPTIGIVDSNCDPRLISYPIPANDDTFKANIYYLKLFEAAIKRGKAQQALDAKKMKT